MKGRQFMQTLDDWKIRELKRIARENNLRSIQDVIRIACEDWVRWKRGDWSSL